MLGCLEDMLNYLNRLGLAYMAISGKPYCHSAWHGFLLNLKHCIKFYFAQTIGGFFVTIGKIFITLLNTGIFIGILCMSEKDDLGTKAMVGLSGIVLSWIICSITLGLFDEAIMATLLCLAVDMDLNDGEPKFGSPSFQEGMERIRSKGEEKGHGDYSQINHDGVELSGYQRIQ